MGCTGGEIQWQANPCREEHSRCRAVFVEKVLKKLFPNVPRGQEKWAPQTSALEVPPRRVTSERVKHKHDRHLTDGDIRIQPERRLYTVSLPPEGYVPCLPEASSCMSSENATSGDDTEGAKSGGREDLDPHDQPKRRRIRKHKSKKKFKNPNNVHVEQAELEKQQSFFQEKLQPQLTDGPTMSKNKRRKLKKKQQMRRKKAAGLVTKASGISFMYQPEDSSSEQEDGRGSAGEGAQASLEEDKGDCSEKGTVTDAIQEDANITNSKADSILNFLKSTQEIYFYDGVSKDLDLAVCMETTKELLHCLESHRMSPSDVFILDHMKTLLLVQDTGRLKRALEMFPEHCLMPPDHAKVISAFFNYWITHILPEKNKMVS
ncbi:glutamate-rich protein 1 isoform X3 [Castor canadensis]|uniref:Glutamate-rich protein 1 isoform X3 n=1 Tax=Castor canadensis TaxID=51338 RepID=A0AC58L2R6_CASCN